MNPSEMNSAQLLDATIEAMVEAGPEGFDPTLPYIRPGKPCCVVGWSQKITGLHIYGVATADKRIRHWYEVSWQMFGTIVPVLADEATSFDDLIAKLRIIKSAL